MVGLLLFLFLGWLMYSLRQLATPILLGLFLAYLLHPIVHLLGRLFKIPHWLAVLILYILLLIILITSTTSLGIAASQEVLGIVDDLGTLAEELPEQLTKWSQSNIIIGPLELNLSDINLQPLVEQLTSAIQPVLLGAGSLLGSLVTTAASALGMLLLVMVIGFYLMMDFERLKDVCLDLVPETYTDDIGDLLEDTGRVWQAFLRGQLILGLVIGILVTIVLSILGVRFSIGLGIIAGLLEFVPIFGPLIAGLIAALVAFFQSGNWLDLSPLSYTILIVIVFIVIQQLENNILVPRIIGHSLNLNPLIVLLATLAGGILAGILGIMLAAPMVATMRLWVGYIYRKIVGLGTAPESVLGPPPSRSRPAIFRRIRGWFEARRQSEKAEVNS
jgi:predicted PurR-regulated permease PerM